MIGEEVSSAIDVVSRGSGKLEKGRLTPQLEHPQLEHCPLQLGQEEQEQPPGMLTSGLELWLDCCNGYEYFEFVFARSLLVRYLRGGRKQVFGPACLYLAKRPTYPSL